MWSALPIIDPRTATHCDNLNELKHDAKPLTPDDVPNLSQRLSKLGSLEKIQSPVFHVTVISCQLAVADASARLFRRVAQTRFES